MTEHSSLSSPWAFAIRFIEGVVILLLASGFASLVVEVFSLVSSWMGRRPLILAEQAAPARCIMLVALLGMGALLARLVTRALMWLVPRLRRHFFQRQELAGKTFREANDGLIALVYTLAPALVAFAVFAAFFGK